MNLLILLLSLILRSTDLSSGSQEGIQAADNSPSAIEDATLDSDGAGRFRDRFVRR